MDISNLSALRTALSLVLVVALVAAPTAAQEDPDRDHCICVERPDGENIFGRAIVLGNRARIGILMGEAVEVDGHDGVEVVEVMPDGPAEAAGLMAGDVITAVNGSELGDPPNEGLLEALSDVDPGDAITLAYYRDGDRRTADLITDEHSGVSVFRSGGDGWNVRVAPRVRANELRERIGRLEVVTPGTWIRRLGGSGLDLVELNPGLGEYFGTDQGVLVADVDDDSALGLRAGDVILSIDGREVRDPAHAHSILGSYRVDEDITFEIVRRERSMEVTGSIH